MFGRREDYDFLDDEEGVEDYTGGEEEEGLVEFREGEWKSLGDDDEVDGSEDDDDEDEDESDLGGGDGQGEGTRKRDRESAEEEREAKRLAKELQRSRLLAAIAGEHKKVLTTEQTRASLKRQAFDLEREQERAKLALEKEKYALGKQKRQDAAKTLKGVLTLGGVPLTQKERRELYFGRVKRSMYSPKAPKEPVARDSLAAQYLKPSTKSPAAEALKPKLDEDVKSLHNLKFSELKQVSGMRQEDSDFARQLVVPETGTLKKDLFSGVSNLRRASLPGQGDLSFVRNLIVPDVGKLMKEPNLKPFGRLAKPKDMSPSEQIVYAEIGSDPDKSTVHRVIAEVSKLGVSRAEAEEALKSLLQKGYIELTKEFQGEEPILKVVENAGAESPIMLLSRGQTTGIGLVGGLRA